MVWIQLLLMVLALLDITAGSTLLLNLVALSSYLGYAMLVKGLWTVLSSFNKDLLFMLIGTVDCIAGAFLVMTSYSIVFSFFWIAGAIVILKGIWSLVSSL